ncbi:MAG: hypothetical protein ACLFQV_08135 [Vulcanimicrobiota bacterium]
MVNSIFPGYGIANQITGIKPAPKQEEASALNLSDSVKLSFDKQSSPSVKKQRNSSHKENRTDSINSKETSSASTDNKTSSRYQPAPLFIEEQTQEFQNNSHKKKLIHSLIDPGMKPERLEKLAQRLEKYPEAALKLIKDDGASYSKKKSGFLITRRLGYYTHEGKSIHLANGTLSDFSRRHPGIAKMLSGSKPAVYALAAAGIAATAPFVLPGLAAGITAACVAPVGLASVPLSWLLGAGQSDVPVHETAHALDFALGRRGKFKNMKIDKRYIKMLEDRQRMQNAGTITMVKKPDLDPSREPASVKSREIMDCYLACKDWQNKGAQFLTDYAGTNPKEYFAECVKAYLNPDKTESDICRQDLIQKDPSMYNFLDNLFKEINTGAYN